MAGACSTMETARTTALGTQGASGTAGAKQCRSRSTQITARSLRLWCDIACPWPYTAFLPPFIDLPLPFHCLSALRHCLSSRMATAERMPTPTCRSRCTLPWRCGRTGAWSLVSALQNSVVLSLHFAAFSRCRLLAFSAFRSLTKTVALADTSGCGGAMGASGKQSGTWENMRDLVYAGGSPETADWVKDPRSAMSPEIVAFYRSL